METITSLAIQQTVMVEQSTHNMVLYLPSMEPPISSTTQYYLAMVVQSTQTVLNLPSTEPITLSIIQPIGNLVLVVQFSAHHVTVTLYLVSLATTTILATQQLCAVV